ncbi:MAG: dihydrolipoyl dehydrogenase, partial [Candidatus Poribacteria bacterium]|nr:dihydrolipoyl dehydrogenase [Candidatus Poribacteria bacterium]
MSKITQSTQIAVIGGGPGGYTAAFMAGDLGMQVTLIDLEPNPGGVCLYRGCIPSKALLHLAKVIADSREAVHWGIDFGEPTIHLDRIRAWKEGVVGQMTRGLGELCKRRRVEFIQGQASFLDARTLRIEQDRAEAKTLSFEHAILATGSQPKTIPNQPPNSPHILDSTGALEFREIPSNMLVVGGGYIGLELGTVYAALGSKVSVVEMTPGLLPGVDRDLVNVLSRRVRKQLHAIMLNTKVAEMKAEANGIRIRFEGEGIEEPEQVFEKILVAVGRQPNTNGLGLENTAVAVDERGFVRVDPQRRTTTPSIYAIGDITGEPMLAHKAAHEGRVAAEAIAGRKIVFEPRAIPAVVFTDPEIAWCGLTETQAEQESHSVEICRFPWGASGRATTLGRNDGLTKLIVDPKTEQVLGVGIVGPGAGELIAEGALAVEMAAVAADMQWTIHP